MAHAEKDNKEVRLFGEKSLREEAYHKKILQLEKEISNLETLARQQEEPSGIKPLSQPKNLNVLYYESLISFDKKVKKEQEFLEKRATEMIERLELQAQRITIAVEKSFRRKARWLFSITIVLVVPLILLLIFSNVELFSSRMNIRQSNTLSSRISYIRTALQTQTKYHHQYEVTNINVIDGTYIVEIEIKSAPDDKWYLRDVSQEVTKIFQQYSNYAPAEISLLFNGKLYVRAYLTDPAKKPNLQYFY